MRFIKTFVFFVFLMLPPCAYSMAITAPEDSINYTIFILNSDEQLTTENLISGQYDSLFSISNSNDQLDEHKLIWLRVDLNNNTQQADWAMVLDRSIPYVTIYDNENVKQTGAYMSFNSKDVSTDDNVIRLTIESGISRSLYLKIENHRGVSEIPVLKCMPWKNWQAEKFKKWSEINLIIGFYTGSNLLVSIALLFFYASTKDKTYLALAIYLLCHILYEMGVEGYYWFIIGEIPQLFWIIQSIFLAGFYIGFYLFLRYYFNLKVIAPVWNKVLKGINILFVVWFMFRVIFPDLELFRSILIISAAALTIIFFITLLLGKNPIVKFVFWGSITFFMSLISAILLYNFEINFINPSIIVKLGIIGQIILYSLGLSYKVKLINENLEILVQERTDKIKNQNQKLIDYAFQNSHNVRGPLARILGLVNLITIENKDTNTDYVLRLSESSQELDSSIREMSKMLEDEDFIDDDIILPPPHDH